MIAKGKPRQQMASWLILVAVMVSLLAPTDAALAQSQVTLSETVLTFQGLLTEPQQRTVTLTVNGDAIHNLEVVRGDLRDATTGAVILGSSISVDPLTLDEVSGSESFQVTVTGAGKPGHYTGQLEFRYDELSGETPPVLDLEATLEAVPDVAADVNSQDLTLYVQQPWQDFPFVGRPSADPEAAVLADVTPYLVQRGDGQADIQQAAVLTLRGAKGQTLPAEVVRVDTDTPFTLESGEAKPLRIVAAGRDLRAGEYNGTLMVRVRNQSAQVELPIRVKIKHGWLLSLIVLAGGLALGYVLHWWKEEGKVSRDLMNEIEKLAKELKPGKKLQADIRDGAMVLLQEAAKLVDEGAPESEIREKYQAAKNLVDNAQTAADTLLNDTLAPLVQRVQAPGAGQAKRRQFEEELKRIQNRVIQGEYRSLEEAQELLTHPSQGIQAQVQYLEELEGKLTQVSPDKQEAVTRAFAEQTEFKEMRRVLKDAGVELPPPKPGLDFAAEPHEPARSRADVFELSWKRKLLLSVPGALAAIVGYVFALAVGWVSIYVASDTFGANPQEYISLFLWGGVVEAVRGNTITLTGLKAIQSGAGEGGGDQ